MVLRWLCLEALTVSRWPRCEHRYTEDEYCSPTVWPKVGSKGCDSSLRGSRLRLGFWELFFWHPTAAIRAFPVGMASLPLLLSACLRRLSRLPEIGSHAFLPLRWASDWSSSSDPMDSKGSPFDLCFCGLVSGGMGSGGLRKPGTAAGADWVGSLEPSSALSRCWAQNSRGSQKICPCAGRIRLLSSFSIDLFPCHRNPSPPRLW